MKNLMLHFCFIISLCSCKRNGNTQNPITTGTNVYSLISDKAVYKPGETISFSINSIPANAFVRYRYLNDILGEGPLTGASWIWQAPPGDYKGYTVEVFKKESPGEKTLAAIAVDVSSDWSKFPRYGFLSDFGQKSSVQMDSVINSLNRFHINGLQFYDWQDKHHQPLAGTINTPLASWKDIANRQCYKSTVQGYIDKAHQAGMKAMFYNLCYGALSDGGVDGVQDQWYLYKDAAHKQKDIFSLPKPPFKSDIVFADPSNAGWQQYLAAKNNDVYQVYNFDGYHIDQVGERGNVYNYNGGVTNLGATFNPFIQAMKTAHPAKKLVFNAVNQFGQEGSIATSPVDFLYTEAWTGNEGYKELAAIIQNNLRYSNGKSTVLAAYLNYKKADKPGTFNSPGVLLANSVIFAFGGSHIELGEHMLCKEYFPNNSLQMNAELKKSMIAYYDFLTGYENLLRDGGAFNAPAVTCTDGKMSTGVWPPQPGKVAIQGKSVGSRQVLHLINFANATSFDWRDTDGNQPKPNTIAGAKIQVAVNKNITKVWMASPDVNSGIPQALTFTQSGSMIQFTLPELVYWDMIVIE